MSNEGVQPPDLTVGTFIIYTRRSLLTEGDLICFL